MHQNVSAREFSCRENYYRQISNSYGQITEVNLYSAVFILIHVVFLRKKQIHLDMTPFIAAFKPELLDKFLSRKFIETQRILQSTAFLNESLQVPFT